MLHRHGADEVGGRLWHMSTFGDKLGGQRGLAWYGHLHAAQVFFCLMVGYPWEATDYGPTHVSGY